MKFRIQSKNFLRMMQVDGHISAILPKISISVCLRYFLNIPICWLDLWIVIAGIGNRVPIAVSWSSITF
jgi:hypothetical protein